MSDSEPYEEEGDEQEEGNENEAGVIEEDDSGEWPVDFFDDSGDEVDIKLESV
jgi:hypothetical protein